MLLDLTHTSHTRVRTGVQRVVRSLWAALGSGAEPICFDPYRRAWRGLEAWELAILASKEPARKRRGQWPWRARLRGYLGRIVAAKPPKGAGALPESGEAGLLVPEIFSHAVGRSFREFLPRVKGPRTAIFYDAVTLKLPEFAAPSMAARFPAYLRELLAFDGVAAISEDSRQSLVEYWNWLGVSDPPPVVAIGLGIDPVAPPKPVENSSASPKVGEGGPIVLCVASIEGRKNHLALLDACETLWAQGARFQLRLIGLAQRQTGVAALARIAALTEAGRPLRYDGPVDDAALEAAYQECAFTVYPSLFEGFGLPVLESLARGRPCVCSARGALGESARGGGCLALESVDAPALAGALSRLLGASAELARLGAEARARSFKSWADYARELTDWMASLKP